jgi:5-methylcytosine-specific restriction endonuclease McrA
MASSLSNEDKASIRGSNEPAKVLAALYEVSVSWIGKIRRGVRHLVQKRASNRRWYVANTEQAKQATRKWRVENPERCCEVHRKATLAWNAEHPAEVLANSARRRALKRRATVGEAKAIATIYARAKSAKIIPCAYCKKETRLGDRHVDHVVPLVKGGAHSAENLCVACSACNLRKNDKTANEFIALLAYAGTPLAAR